MSSYLAKIYFNVLRAGKPLVLPSINSNRYSMLEVESAFRESRKMYQDYLDNKNNSNNSQYVYSTLIKSSKN